jgi:hypothetical protein
MERIAKLHKLVFNPKTRDYFQKVSLMLAIGGFLFHLILIYFNMHGRIHFSRGNELLQRPLQALYTPFSFILIEEVYILLGFITYSFSKSIVTQFEIISLFILRGLFKDISLVDFNLKTNLSPELLNLFYNLSALLILIFLVALIRKTIRLKEKEIEPKSLKNFVMFKQGLVLLLLPVLLSYAVVDLWVWAKDQFQNDPDPIQTVGEVNTIFFKEFFTIMIFLDVLILLVSLRYTHSYDILLRNSGYILSTVILRISMTSPMPYSSIGYVLSGGLCLFFVFIFNKFDFSGEVSMDYRL